MLLEALVASIEEEGQTPAKEQLIHTYDGTSLQKKLRAAWADEHEYK